MRRPRRRCADCERGERFDRRRLLRGLSAGAALVGLGNPGVAAEREPPETAVAELYRSLAPDQRKVVCFDWEHIDPARGLLRTRVAANWRITPPAIASEFFTPRQQRTIREIFEGLVQPEWIPRFDRQLQDDAGGWGRQQSVALFGRPGEGKFEFVLTGRHQTLRCDGNSTEHMAFGGPIFYGHAASGFNEKPDHPNNVFWPQALAANEVYKALDGPQQARALVPKEPEESQVGFRPAREAPGIPVGDLSPDQKRLVQKTLAKLVEPFRQADRDETLSCLKTQGGLDACRLAFYQHVDLGNDRVWDVWRLEGPAFVWHFRGTPHVHVWVHVADDPGVKLNA